MVFFPSTMNPAIPLFSVLIIMTSLGCSESKKQNEKAQADAAAKARAEAAKKEMDTLPKVFRSRDIFEKNEPAKSQQNPTDTPAPKKS
jgi:hypothetical protein